MLSKAEERLMQTQSDFFVVTDIGNAICVFASISKHFVQITQTAEIARA